MVIGNESLLKKTDKKSAIFGRNIDIVNKKEGLKKYTRKKKKKQLHIYNNLINDDIIDKAKPASKENKVQENASSIFGSNKSAFKTESIDVDSDVDSDDTGLVDVGIMVTPEKRLKYRDMSDVSSDRELPEIDTHPGMTNEIAQKVASGNILSALHQHSRDKIALTREKFKEYNIPEPIMSKKALIKRVEKHMQTIPGILNGTVHTSHFYELAKEQKMKSYGETINFKEKLLIDWSNFFGGYFGFKRQSFVASVILSRCRKELNSASKKNTTVAYWSPSGFSTYVLANEIIIRLAMEDFNCDFEKGESIIRETVDYGVIVSDSVNLIDDLEVGEMLQEESKVFMKDFEEHLEHEKEQSPSTTEKSNTSLLDNILNVTSSSDDES